ncbi:PP2C family protein-serine/threonine phosphatase, partial [Streptomyces albus]
LVPGEASGTGEEWDSLPPAPPGKPAPDPASASAAQSPSASAAHSASASAPHSSSASAPAEADSALSPALVHPGAPTAHPQAPPGPAEAPAASPQAPPEAPPAPPGPVPRTVSDAPGEQPAAPAVPVRPSGDGAAHLPAEEAVQLSADDVEEVSGAPEALGTTCVACQTGTIDGDGYCEHCGHKQPRDRDHMESALGTVAAASDRGLRHHRNEDYFAIAETTTSEGTPATVAVICDGVSSATRPDDASAAAARAASDALCEALPRGRHPQQAMHDALLAAAEAVNALAAHTPLEPSKNAPACTVVGTVRADGILTVGWIGDSRAYWVPDDRSALPARLTEDDSWAAQMVAAGLMNEAEAYADPRAHAITGWLGADAYELDPHTASFEPDQAGVVVVCTDGLWNYAESAEEMAAALPPDAASRPLHCARHLVGYALDGGGHDNVTVAVVPFPVPSGRAEPA